MATDLRATLGSILIVGAVVVEAAAARALLGDALAVALFCHGLAAALAGAAGAQSGRPADGPPRDRPMRRADALRLAWVSASLVLALPAVGLGGFIVLALVMRARPREQHPPLREIERAWVRTDALGVAPGARLRTCARARLCEPVAGAGSAGDAAVQARLDRLLVLRRVPDARAVRGLRLALADPNEEVRLLAFALLDQREKDLRAIIDDARLELQRLRALEARPGAEARAQRRWLLRLAHAYGELASSTLLGGEPATAAFVEALRFGQDALAIRFDGATALFLARVSLARADLAGAQRWLGDAARGGVAAAARAPCEAELALRQRRVESPAERRSHARRSEREASRRVG